jgi:hypothetical protein
MKLRLLKTEASWIHSRVGCYVSLDNQLLEVITPLNCPHESPTLDIPPEGTLRLIFKDMGRSEGYLGSISFALNSFNKAVTLWLPLYSNPNNDFYSGSEALETRVLVQFITSDTLTPCDDELFHSFSEIPNENDSEIVVASEILPPGDEIIEFCKTSTFKLQKNPGFIEKLALQLRKYMILYSENRNIGLMYKEKCMELEGKLAIYEGKVKELTENNESLRNEMSELEYELMEKINLQETSILELQQALLNSNISLRRVQHENFYDKERLKCATIIGKENVKRCSKLN